MTLLRRRSVFAAKVETTIGTAESITGAEGVYNAMDFAITPTITKTRREAQGGFNKLPGVPEGMLGTCTMKHELTYNGTDIPTWASVLLPACGWVNSGGVFSPKSEAPGSNVKTLTIAQYVDGKRKLLSGAMGTFKMVFPTGKVAYIEFTFTGKYSSNETDTALITPTYPSVSPLRFAQGGLAYNSVALCTSNCEVDAGNNVIMRECVNASDRSGYISALVTDRAPIITADPEAVLVATQDRDALWLTPTPEDLVITINGPGDSSIVVTAPKADLENKQDGDRNGMLIDDLTWLATAGATVDSELTITFNADT
jgi:hypothetical protein